MTRRHSLLTPRQIQRWLYRVRQNPIARKMYRDSRRVERWLQRAGLPKGRVRSHVAMDLSELLIWADDIKRHVRVLLKQNPGTKRGARVAARHATAIEVVLSTDVLVHARGLDRHWGRHVVKPLYARADKRGRRKAAA